MSILATIDKQIRNATYKETDGWFADWLRGETDSDSGMAINASNALKLSTIWKCVNWRAKMFGMLPKKVFERVDIQGRASQREARKHELYELIHTAPNPTISAYGWTSLVSADLHLWGNSYAWIDRFPRSNRIANLWRIVPDAVRIEQEKGTGQLWYWVTRSDGSEERFFPDEILHIRGLGYDGIRGYSPIQMQKQALGWGKASRQYSSKSYRNAFRPSGILTSPVTFKPDVRTKILESLKQQGKEGGLALIEGALEYKQLAIPNDDLQFVETLNFQEEDICGIMEVYPFEVGIMNRLTFNNVEQLTISSITRNLQPFCVNFEQAVNQQLISDMPSTGLGGASARDRFFVECELKVLMRGDMAAQTTHLRELLDKGVYSQNDARDYLGIAPYAGGDRYWINGTYSPIDRMDELIDKKVEPTPEPAAAAPVEQQDMPMEPSRNGNNLAAKIADVMLPLFRDAIGRVLNRRAKDREREVPMIVKPYLLAAAQMTDFRNDKFIDDYVGAMAQRASIWKIDIIENIVTEETARALSALLEKRP